MKLLPSILVGLCAAPLAAIVIGTAADFWANWLRVASRDGAAGYWVVMLALLAAVVAMALGVSIARGWLLSKPSFWSALGTTIGLVSVAGLLITGVIRLGADLPPRVDGRRLELVAEVRFPPGTALESLKSAPPYVAVMRVASRDSRGSGSLDFAAARGDGGQLVVPVTMDFHTRAKEKKLHVGYPDGRNVFFPLGLGSKPEQKDFEWSEWIVSEPPDTSFAVRYKVVVEPPPAPVLTREQQEAEDEAKKMAELRALAPDAPLAQWLVFTRYGAPRARIDAAIAAIRARPDWLAEMAHEMLDGEYESSRDALRAIQHIQPPPAELAHGIAAVGKEIAQTLRDIEKEPPDSERYRALVSGTSTRFSAWMDATRALQESNAADFTPLLQEILEPARRLQSSDVMRIDVVRVASFYLHKWAGIAPLPTDPPPR
jgi:hypothetical protein